MTKNVIILTLYLKSYQVHAKNLYILTIQKGLIEWLVRRLLVQDQRRARQSYVLHV